MNFITIIIPPSQHTGSIVEAVVIVMGSIIIDI